MFGAQKNKDNSLKILQNPEHYLASILCTEDVSLQDYKPKIFYNQLDLGEVFLTYV